MKDREGSASRFTYADVHMVLALLQGWGEGRVSLRHNGLAVDAVIGPLEIPAAAPVTSALQIRSPAVGIFRPQSSAGMLLRIGELMALIEAPGRSMPVVSPLDGKLLRMLVPAGAFVEYDQEIAVIEPKARS
jgi:biotin carboxyl carrier protein